jgi:Flp pilus assembly protein TadD
MKKKAVVTVIPELRYSNGQIVRGNTATFQGEGVNGNDQTIYYRVGGNYTMKTNFAYVGDNKAEMFLTFDARLGKKQVEIPAVKVADGIIATSELYRRTVTTANAAIAPDAYQRITKKKQEANIKFLIQQANIRKSELKNNSVQEFVKMLKQINDDREGLNLDNVEVSAYASPDGGFNINDKLANQRQKVSEQYVNQELKKIKMDANVDAKYTAQDWEGFQELVQASNIQDKDIILRVLSMYKDPQEREQQIKNISAAFRELADGILPELRRSRLTINYETIGRSDAQILDQIKADATKLSIEELLYGAAINDDAAQKEKTYKLATQVYPNDARAYNNLAALAYAKGDYDAARDYIQQAQRVAPALAEAKANLGMLALAGGDVATAEQYIAAATDANGLAEVLGNLNLAKGNYAQAEQDFADIYSNSAALAQILNKNYATADITLRYVKNPDATTEYLKAILYARMGNTADAAEALRNAVARDASYAQYAAKDIELAKIQK